MRGWKGEPPSDQGKRGPTLGHASIRTTSDRYGHLYDAARERLRDHLDATYRQTKGAGAGGS
jgi:hypothetical protein